MMSKSVEFFELFDQFIFETKSGKRLSKSGTIIKQGTIKLYEIVRNNLTDFSNMWQFDLGINPYKQVGNPETGGFINYWKSFYLSFTSYLYSKGFYDNYVGLHIKILKAFKNYLNDESGTWLDESHKKFHCPVENIPIIALSPEKLNFLINNKGFEDGLPKSLKKTKDIFVFGCTVGLRFSDLKLLTTANVEEDYGGVYLSVRSVKTSTETKIKLPPYANTILIKYTGGKMLLPIPSLFCFNKSVKRLCELAGWTKSLPKQRSVRGILIEISDKNYRFCDLVSSHTMRRTAITVLVCLGVPENLVRKISGHSPSSKEFYKYVDYAQHYKDKETDKAFDYFNSF